MHFEIYQENSRSLLGTIGKWRWRLKADNGRQIAQGEDYVNLQDCLHAVQLVKQVTFVTPVVNAATGHRYMI